MRRRSVIAGVAAMLLAPKHSAAQLADFHLKKGLEHLQAVRERFQTITDRFAGFPAQWLNVHVDFPMLQRLALPITVG